MITLLGLSCRICPVSRLASLKRCSRAKRDGGAAGTWHETSANLLGFTRLAGLCLELEQEAGQERLAEARELLVLMEKEYRRAENELGIPGPAVRIDFGLF